MQWLPVVWKATIASRTKCVGRCHAFEQVCAPTWLLLYHICCQHGPPTPVRLAGQSANVCVACPVCVSVQQAAWLLVDWPLSCN